MTQASLSSLAIALILAAALSGDAASAQDIRGLQDRWMQCLKESFKLSKKYLANPNAAAEDALRACATEEEELWEVSAAAGVPRSAFAHLKAATKQVLIQGR